MRLIINLKAARERLRTVAHSIDKARMELIEIKGDLRPSSLERSRVVDLGDNPGASTDMRSTIDCVNQNLESRPPDIAPRKSL